MDMPGTSQHGQRNESTSTTFILMHRVSPETPSDSSSYPSVMCRSAARLLPPSKLGVYRTGAARYMHTTGEYKSSYIPPVQTRRDEA
jgi:hypothetical protein